MAAFQSTVPPRAPGWAKVLTTSIANSVEAVFPHAFCTHAQVDVFFHPCAKDGKVFVSQQAVPGDVANAIVSGRRKGLQLVKVESYKKESSDRSTPFCSHFGRSGQGQKILVLVGRSDQKKTRKDKLVPVGCFHHDVLQQQQQLGQTQSHARQAAGRRAHVLSRRQHHGQRAGPKALG